jgi:hypothetical protein
VAAFETGTPYTVTNKLGDAAEVVSDFSQHAQLVPNCDINAASRTVSQWFNTSCFQDAATGTFGNSGRNMVWGPGVANWDFALYKNGPLTERLKYQFRAELFNFLNHPSYGAGTGILDTGRGDSSYGQITGVGDPREIQFGLKLIF